MNALLQAAETNETGKWTRDFVIMISHTWALPALGVRHINQIITIWLTATAPTGTLLEPSRPKYPAPTHTLLVDHRWESKHLNLVAPNKNPDQSTGQAHSHFKIAIKFPLLMTSSGSKSIKLRRQDEVFQVPFIGWTVTPVAQPRQQLAQTVFLVDLFSTSCAQHISLLTHAMTVKSIMTAPVVPAFSLSSDSRVAMLAEPVLNLHIIPVGKHSARPASLETCRVLLEVFKQRTAMASKQDHCEVDCDSTTHFNVLSPHGRTTDVTNGSAELESKNSWCTTRLRHDRNTERCELESRNGWTRSRVWDYQTTFGTPSDEINMSWNTVPSNQPNSPNCMPRR